jgi:transcriptional regulator with XRE-family HTH domain
VECKREKTIHSGEYQILLRLLRHARKRAGFTQAQVAERLKYQPAAVSKLELGELRMDIIQLRDYCRAIGVPLVEFIMEFEAASDA